MKDKDNKGLVNQEDDEYERRIYLEEIAENSEEHKKELQKLEKQREAERAKRIQQEKLELMKLKSGVIEESEIIKEEHEAPAQLTASQKVGNFWYHYKIPLIVGTLMLAAVIYIIYDTVTRVKPDVYVLSTCDNGLEFRTEQLEKYFEKFCPDVNGDGKIKVQVISAPESEDFQISNSNQAKIITQLQMDKTIIVLTCDDVFDLKAKKDENGNYAENSYVFAECFDDLTEDFPGDEKVIEKGYKFYGEALESALEWDNMPKNIVLSLRKPVKPLTGKLEVMKENYSIAFEMLEKIMEENSEQG